MNLLLTFLPDEALPLLLVAIGLGVVLGFRKLSGLIPGILLSLVLAPLLSCLLGGLPPIVSVALFVGFVFVAIRMLFNLVLGAAAADHMVGALAAGVVHATFGLLFGLPILLLRTLFGAASKRRDLGGRP